MAPSSSARRSRPGKFIHGLQLLFTLWLFDLWAMVFVFQWILRGSDRLAAKLFRQERRSQFILRGQCRRTGLCCQTLGIELPASWLKHPRIVVFFQRWYALVHNFQTVGPPQGQLLPLSCGYLREGNVCAIYPYRPKLCRDYPQTGLFGKIQLHRGCGFWFVPRDKQGGFEEKLLREQHESERRNYLRNPDGD